MQDPQSAIDIFSGVAALLTLIGIPTAAIVTPISLIISGIFGLRSKKK